MDWLRRNWPDLLIGVALVAVIAGIIATLISGGSFFPATNRNADDPTPSAPLTSTPTPGASSDPLAADPAEPAGAAGQPGASRLTTTPAGQTPDAEADAAAAGDDAPAAAAGAAAPVGAQGLPVAVLPPAGSPAASSPITTPGATPAAAGATPAAATTAATTPAAPTVDLGAASQPDAPYRVSVGAYANRANAERQAEAFRAAGYPVFIGAQGALNIVLVGPYDTEAEARSVAARIRQSDMGVADPTVYEFDENDAAPAANTAASPSPVRSTLTSTAAQVTPATPTPDAGEDAVISTAASSTPGARYLQVGAYATRDSSLPQRERLEGLGFVVSERIESDLIKLLIGPFDAANLGSAQGRLEAAGIASFPR